MTLIANLPSAFVLVSASSSQGSCTGTVQVSCPLGTIQMAGVVTATINVTPIATGSISMTASVNGGTADPSPSNNSATVTVTVLPPGLPPILWMGGGTSFAADIFTTLDGKIWTLGPEELLQWRASDLRLLKSLAQDIGTVSGNGEPIWYDGHSFALTSDGNYLAYGSNTGVASVYRTSDGSLVRSFTGGPTNAHVSLSDDGQVLAFTTDGCGCCYCGGSTVIANVSSGAVISGLPQCQAVALSPDGIGWQFLVGRTFNCTEGWMAPWSVRSLDTHPPPID